jgi:hypothetical protein
MNKYLERRNINLQNEADTNNDQSNDISPHKKLVSDKTEMKKSKSRPRVELNGVDESLEKIMPHNTQLDSMNRQIYKRDPSSMDIPKPFQQHNANKKAEVQHINATTTPISNKNIQRSYDSLSKNEFNSKETEKHISTYHSKQEAANFEVELTKHNLHSYKSHSNLTRFKVRKSPSTEYLKIKKKIEKDMTTPHEKLFRDQHIRN